MINLLIGLTVTLLAFCLMMIAISKKGAEEKHLNDRMAYFSGVEASLRNIRSRNIQQDDSDNLTNQLHKTVKALGARLEKFIKYSSFDRKMQQAGWPLLGSEFQVVFLGSGLAGGIILGLLTMTPIHGLVGMAAGCLLCMVIVEIRIHQRQKAFVNQLADMLTMISNALRAGFSFMQALDHIASEMEDPVKTEIRKVIMDVNIGIPLEEALNKMTDRVGSSDFHLVVAAVLIQRQVGGNLAQVLDNISETINERVRMRQEINTLTTQGKMSGLVLGCMPFALALLFQLVNPNYLNPLWENPLGQMAVAGALILMAIGAGIIYKIVNIKM